MKLHQIIIFILFSAFLNCDLFMDFDPPQIKIISPKQGETVYGQAEIIIEADDNKKLHNVELFLDDEKVIGFNTKTLTHTWDLTGTKIDSDHTVKAIAYDNNNSSEAKVSFFGYGKLPAGPELLTPLDEGTLFCHTPLLEWKGILAAKNYHLQIDNNPDFSSPFISDISITNTNYHIEIPLEPYHNYYWRVCALSDWGNQGAWSESFVFLLSAYKWKFQSGDEGSFFSPALGYDGTVYFLPNWSNLYAINPQGELKWKYQTDCSIISCPAIGSDGTIHVATSDSCLYAINPDGSLCWEFKVNNGISADIAIGSDDMIYAGSENGTLYAIFSDGTLNWKSEIQGMRKVQSIVVSIDRTLHILTNNYLYAVSRQGKELWKFKHEGSGMTKEPILDYDGTIYLTSSNCLYTINKDGNLKWKTDLGMGLFSFIMGTGGMIYINNGRKLLQINSNGVLVRENNLNFSIQSLPLAASDGNIYIVLRKYNDKNYTVVGVNSNDEIIVDYPLDFEEDTLMGINFRSAIDLDGTIYLGTTSGTLYALPGLSSGLANSPWPKYRHDNQNTGRASN